MKYSYKFNRVITHPRRSKGEGYFLYSVRLCSDGDAWGTCMMAFFGLADYMHHKGFTIPREWQFSPSPFGPDTDNEQFRECKRLRLSALQCQRLGRILERWCSILKARGQDY